MKFLIKLKIIWDFFIHYIVIGFKLGLVTVIFICKKKKIINGCLGNASLFMKFREVRNNGTKTDMLRVLTEIITFIKDEQAKI